MAARSHSHGNQLQFYNSNVTSRVEMAGCAHYVACFAKLYANNTLYGPLFAEACTEMVLTYDIYFENTNILSGVPLETISYTFAEVPNKNLVEK